MSKRFRWIVGATIGLLSFVLIVSVGVPIARRLNAIQAICNQGGAVSLMEQSQTTMLERLFGDALVWLSEVDSVSFSVTDSSFPSALDIPFQQNGPPIGIPRFAPVVRRADLAQIAVLHTLRELDVSDQPITDAELIHLQRLNRLQALDLSRTRITDEGLMHLAKLTSLESLVLDGTDIRGPGLRHLAGLSRLQSLSLENTAVTDSDLACLGSCERLHVLNLKGTGVTEGGLARLRGMMNLPQLELTSSHLAPSR